MPIYFRYTDVVSVMLMYDAPRHNSMRYLMICYTSPSYPYDGVAPHVCPECGYVANSHQEMHSYTCHQHNISTSSIVLYIYISNCPAGQPRHRAWKKEPLSRFLSKVFGCSGYQYSAGEMCNRILGNDGATIAIFVWCCDAWNAARESRAKIT